MKYNLDICMKDMINDMKNDMKGNASWVALNDNENEKMLGPHALLCAHASGDTPSSSIYYGRVCY